MGARAFLVPRVLPLLRERPNSFPGHGGKRVLAAMGVSPSCCYKRNKAMDEFMAAADVTEPNNELLEKLWTAYDANEDGVLDHKELTKILADYGASPDPSPSPTARQKAPNFSSTVSKLSSRRAFLLKKVNQNWLRSRRC